MAKREKTSGLRIPEMAELTIDEKTPASTIYNYYINESNEKKKKFFQEAWKAAYRREKENKK
jgi:hypothetical protein